jgi:dTDP-4-dehydrorhamnose reductase
MRVLITGANGQLGQAIQRIAEGYDHQFDYTDVDELDITNRLMVDEYFLKTKPDIVINCAGYTNVEKAESEPEIAKSINCDAVGILANAAVKHSVKIIHISTDFVFDGTQKRPYLETDQPNPVNVYGKTKYGGEMKLIKSQTDGLILRTSWLFSEYGHNFVKNIHDLAKMREEIRVVNDQYGSPTYAKDLANIIMKLIESDKWENGCEVYHFCNRGEASWYDLAQEIVKISNLNCKIIPVSSEEYGSKVKRPGYSILDTSKISEKFSLEIRPWKETVGECLRRIRRGEREKGRKGERVNRGIGE